MHYQYLNGENWQHIWIVGDLHGCRSQLDALMQRHNFDKQQDLLVAVGDLIDRGPDSPGCLQLLEEPWFRSVRGNHEEMALDALAGQESMLWAMNGGEWFWQLRGASLVSARHALKRCQEMPLIIHLQLSDRIVVVAHADYPSDHYAWGQDVDWREVVWNRARLNRYQRGDRESITGADAFYFGHTPLQQPLDVANLHYIDTGAVFGNRLTMVQVQ
ncbi:metallophosphoesterase [[Erwinia] mediterraneensis]|uniref:metallophosphoesterase n=1 Tax=[Erwinia] mediterraneensis TaxID=2161819 RepID=UPI00102F3B0D|nr:metallophosphoesterase [[Erwinia] mediterraneensis]